MSRTLRRPMFRGGGKIESRGTGITSGLDDRPGYQDGPGPNIMDQVRSEAEDLIELNKQLGILSEPEKPATTFGLTRPELLKLAQRSFEFASKGGDETFGQKLTGSASDALGDIATSMQARKEKFKEEQKSQDLIKSGLIEKVYEATQDKLLEQEKGKYGSDSVFTNKLVALELDYNRDMKNATTDAQKAEITKKYEQDRKNIITDADTLNIDSLIAENLLKDDKIRTVLSNEIRDQLEKSEYVEGTQEYLDEYVRLLTEASLNLVKDLGYQKGGRVGKANGGMTTTMNTNDQMTLKQPEQTPTGLSYDLVRARIPESVGNDIVRLIVMSPVALEDFADIQTQVDVDNFNQKYNVNLTLPQSGV